jgi:peptide/nickel transport system substrate-binding protein
VSVREGVMIKGRKHFYLVVLFVMVLTVQWAAPFGAESKTVPKGKVVVALGTNLETMDPHMHNVMLNFYATWAIYDNLVYRDPKTLENQPHLAESWRLIDNKTWEFKLRKGVVFHNGNPFNAEAVKFNIERVINPKQNSRFKATFSDIERMEVVDNHTIRFFTQAPSPIFLSKFTNFGIVDPRYLKEVGDEGLSKKAVGTGPYKFVSWDRGGSLVLEANENYWKFTPAVKTVILRPIPEMATQLAELLSGGVDIITNVPPDQVPLVRESKNARISTAPSLRVAFLQFDADGRAGSTPLQNVKVRMALNHAIDVDGMIKHILGGLAVRTPTGLNPMSFGFDKTIKPYPYDPEKARQLLREAGHPQGFTMNLASYGGTVLSVDQIVQAISGDLSKVGIKVASRHYEDTATFSKLWATGKLKDSVLASWASASIFDADQQYYPMLRQGERFCYASDPTMNRLLDDARSTMDLGKRKKLYSDFQKHFVANAYWVPLYAQPVTLGISSKINYEACSDDMLRVFDITWKE